jgi:hypothetical protein
MINYGLPKIASLVRAEADEWVLGSWVVMGKKEACLDRLDTVP